MDHGKQEVAQIRATRDRRLSCGCHQRQGERLERPELDKIEAMLRTGELDLLDIGRLVRGAEAVKVVRHRR